MPAEREGEAAVDDADARGGEAALDDAAAPDAEVLAPAVIDLTECAVLCETPHSPSGLPSAHSIAAALAHTEAPSCWLTRGLGAALLACGPRMPASAAQDPLRGSGETFTGAGAAQRNTSSKRGHPQTLSRRRAHNNRRRFWKLACPFTRFARFRTRISKAGALLHRCPRMRPGGRSGVLGER